MQNWEGKWWKKGLSGNESPGKFDILEMEIDRPTASIVSIYDIDALGIYFFFSFLPVVSH